MTYLTKQQTVFPIYRVVDGKRTRIGIAFTAEAADTITRALNRIEVMADALEFYASAVGSMYDADGGQRAKEALGEEASGGW